MSTIRALVKRHPLPTYFGLAFALSWGGLLMVVGRGGFTGATEPTDRQLPFVYLAMFTGPTVAGILLTGLVEGTAGFRELRSRLFRWQVGARWYAVAGLTAPLLIMATLSALSLSSPSFRPSLLACSRAAIPPERSHGCFSCPASS